MKLIDTHTHLYAKEFEQDRDQIIANCKEKGIEHLFLPNIDSSSISGMMELSEKYPNYCLPMMGLHPCSVKEDYKQELNLIEKWLEKDLFCAVGEIGIDLYWDQSFIKQQQDAFRIQIEMAKAKKLPIVIHCRESFNEIFEIVDELNDDRLTGIFHCFTGSLEQAHHILNYGGFKLGIGGVITFKNAGLDKVIEQLDINDLVLETDSPYLAPTPYRGQRNESTYLYEIALKVATTLDIPFEAVAEATTKNAQEVFSVN